MQLAITEMSSKTNTVNNTTVADAMAEVYHGAANNKIRVNTKGFVKGCAEVVVSNQKLFILKHSIME